MPASARGPGPDDAALVFPRTAVPKGFATLATQQWDGNPEPVVREMLQNSLDACVKAGRTSGEVSFTVREIATDELPGIDEYRKHFDLAVRERAQQPQGPAEKAIIRRISGVLNQERVRLLLCRDNGIGLRPETMRGLLTEGNTDKADAGAGAFGIGHLTAFAASDLRYVLYAGRNGGTHAGSEHGPGGYGHGGADVIAGAHAILATRSESADDGGARGLGAHGFWLLRDGSGRSEQLGLFRAAFPNVAPALLRPELDLVQETGTVVCIAGFNRFRCEDENPVDAIARVAAKNFLVAIHSGAMTVHVRDETVDPPVTVTVERGRLRALLLGESRQKRSRVVGWLAGEQAFRCVRTLEEGRTLELACGALAKVRRLDSSEGGSSRVQLFRDGMWITNRADKLCASDFAGYNPFDAAIMIDGGMGGAGGAGGVGPDGGEITRLVRAAEGPEHRGLDRRRLETREERRRLLKLLRQIKWELQSWAGVVEQVEEYTPENFAVLGGKGREADKIRPYRPRQDREDEETETNATTEQRSEEGGTIDPRRTGRGRKGGKARPLPGHAVPGRTAVVALTDARGRAHTLRVHWKPDVPLVAASDRLGVRVRIPSGSDATCELPLGPRWLRMKEVRPSDAEPTSLSADGFEADLPHGEIEFSIILESPIADPNAVEVDVVRRRLLKPKDETGPDP